MPKYNDFDLDLVSDNVDILYTEGNPHDGGTGSCYKCTDLSCWKCSSFCGK